MTILPALTLLSACRDYDFTAADEEQPVDILSRFNAEGEAYLTLQIPLGVGTMTRAVTFDDGEDNEWQVRDAYILIFAGANETTATFASAYNVTLTTQTSPLEQITATATVVINDQNLNTGDKLYVFVLLNNNSSAISTFSKSSVAFANGTTITTGSTLTDLQTITIANYKDNDNYFLMTNAPLASANDGTGSITTLVEVPASYFFPTEAEARANPGGQIYVERLAAKTTVVIDNSINLYIQGNSYATFANADLAFALDNYNTSGFACRHLSTVAYPRLVETAPLPSGKYRTYWATDNNYSGNSGLVYKDHAHRSEITWLSTGNSVYCAENTFDVSHMQNDCTASVLVRLQLNGGGDFYTTSVTGQDIVFQPPSNTVTEEGTSASSSFSRAARSQTSHPVTRSTVVTYDGTNTATIDDYLRTWLMENNSDFRAWVNTYAAGEPKHVRIAVTTPVGGGPATATATQTAQDSGSTGATDFAALSLDSYIAANISLQFYDDGYCYYRVPIRHFDDTQTPWSSIPSMTNNTTGQAYAYSTAGTAFTGTDDEKAAAKDQTYLGRYGMVRNNWYTIDIKSVTHIGSPTIPALTTDADDTVEQLLNATLSISGWTQNNITP